MINEVKEIISKDFEEIYTSSLSLRLLDIYSKLYLNGSQPKYCKASQLSYYNRLLVDGINKAIIMDDVLKKTHKTDKVGLMYVGKPFCKHYDLANMTDKDATNLLQSGWLKEKDFSKLPDLYKEEKEVEKQILAEEKKAAKPKVKK